MTLPKREHPVAREELRSAALWYDDQHAGLGKDFLDAIDEAIERLLDRPHSAPIVAGWEDEPQVRSMRVRVFPYRVLYYITDTAVVIVAYAHQRRRPGYWHHRVE